MSTNKNQINIDENDEDFTIQQWTLGKCCFCGNDCNMMSQSCGACARAPKLSQDPKQLSTFDVLSLFNF